MILIALFALAAYALSPFLASLLMGVVLATVGWPLQMWLEKRFKLPRWLGAAAHATFWLALIVLPVGLILEPAGEKLAPIIMRWRTETPLLQLPPQLAQVPLIGGWLEQQISSLTANALLHYLGGHSNLVAAWVWRIWTFILHTVFAVLTVFMIGLRGDLIARELTAISQHLWGERGPQLLQIANKSARAIMLGLIGISVAEGILIGFAYGFAGMPLWSIWALATVLLSLIPFGAAVVLLAASAWLTLTGAWVAGLMVAAWGFIVITVADLVFRPLFAGAQSRVPFLLVLFSILGGVKVFGLIGLIIGPMLVTLAGNLWQEWLRVPQMGKERDSSSR